jgi:hypothetical protein
MGARSARIFERGDAGGLIGVVAGDGAGIDMGHSKDPVLGVQIGIEHALAPAKLELEARAFVDLESRRAEMSDQLLRAHAGEAGRFARLRNGLGGLLDGLLRARGAAGEDQGRSEDDAAHARTMPAPVARGKVAAAALRR